MLEASVDADASDGEQPDVSDADVEGLLAKTGSPASAPAYAIQRPGWAQNPSLAMIRRS